MQHHRCTKCRNPIRGVPVPFRTAAECDWYHTDCWAEVQASEQEDYRQDVRTSGLSALFAP